MARQQKTIRWIAKPLLFACCMVPASLLLWGVFQDQLGANPIESITHTTGDWALRFLLLTLAISPLRRVSGWTVLLRFRRMLGLFAFFYAMLHLLTWLLLDQTLRWEAILEDIGKRPYITLGFAAFLLLVPLALTSTRGMMRRLGRGWARLHRLVYPAAILVVLHYLWLVKADYLQPGLYAALLAVLLLARVRFPRRSATGGGRVRSVAGASRARATRPS
jgi:sulfoxide reductase heme-binding subunit YedZ